MVEVGLLGAVLEGAALPADDVHHALLAVGSAEQGPLEARLVEAGPFGTPLRLTLLAWHSCFPLPLLSPAGGVY